MCGAQRTLARANSMARSRHLLASFLLATACAAAGRAQTGASLADAVKAKVEAKIEDLRFLSLDSRVVSAVKDYNADPPADAKAMTNEEWTILSAYSRFVLSLSENDLAEYLRSIADDSIAEIYASGADGGKVALLAKTMDWNDTGKPAHDIPMTGETWIGEVVSNPITRQQFVEVGLPVFSEGEPIGSLVIRLRVDQSQ